MKPLTKAQVEELKRLAREPQPTYGCSRARVQNNLYYGRGYVRFLDQDGNSIAPHIMGLNPCTEVCEITPAGREALAQATKKG